MRPLLTLTLAGAALLAAAPTALANTAVSRETGTFGAGLSGDYIWVTDPASLGDKRMDVHVTRVANEIVVTDLNGATQTHGGGCYELGASVHCAAAGLAGLKIEGGDANDVLQSDVNLPNVIDGDGGDDSIDGGPANDQITGEDGSDTEHGNGGNDSFGYEHGKDVLDGDAGTDTVSYVASPVAVDVTLDDALFNDGQSGEPDRVADIENATGSPFDDFIRGNTAANVLRGAGGADMLRGSGGDDLLDGGAGPDDQSGGTGLDTVTYSGRFAHVGVTIDDVADDGQTGEGDSVRTDVENVDGGLADDTLSGSSAANILTGGNGDDTLDGGAGDDHVNGGAGADTLIGDQGSDHLEGGTGLDTADYSARDNEDLEISPNSLTGNDDGGPSDGPAGARDDVSGVEITRTGDADDVLHGTDANDSFITGDGNDQITGGLGIDAVDAGPGADTLNLRDGVNDAPVKCGAGRDTALVDAFPLDFQGPFGALQLQDCETFIEPK